MVRYPKPHKFNGTLAVEWTNVTIGVDFEFATAEASEYLLREGYAVAIVSAQRVGVERLKTWSPQRYPGLSVDVNKCGAGGTSLCTGDPLSYDIFAQITQALLENRGGAAAPMPGLRVKDAIAIGQSQSAGRLAIYYNTIQPLHNVFDGIAFWDRSGQLRSDLTVPAISVNSEGLGGSFGGAAWTTSEYTRKWDVAGSTHASLYGAEYIEAISARDLAITQFNGVPKTFIEWIDTSPTTGGAPGACVTLPAFTTVDVGLVYNKAIDSVRNWYKRGTPAAPSRSFVTTPTGTLVRDADGKVEGGIRLPQFLVPTADQGALNGTLFPCNVSGWHRYYTPEELKAMYGTHGHYVSAGARCHQSSRQRRLRAEGRRDSGHSRRSALHGREVVAGGRHGTSVWIVCSGITHWPPVGDARSLFVHRVLRELPPSPGPASPCSSSSDSPTRRSPSPPRRT